MVTCRADKRQLGAERTAPRAAARRAARRIRRDSAPRALPHAWDHANHARDPPLIDRSRPCLTSLNVTRAR